MAIPQGTIGLPQLGAKPSAPGAGTVIIYTKTDDVLYLQDDTGTEVPFGSASSITSLTGDVSGTGPGAAATTVNSVGGYSASAIASSVAATQAATPVNTASTIVKRDASGNFSANLITANLSGNATTATTAVNFSGSLFGDVTGTQGATVVSTVGGYTASAIAASVLATQDATSVNTASTIVERDASGNFSAGTITANLTGNVTGNVSGSSSSFTGSLLGDVTGTQGATVVSTVGGSTAANIHSAEVLANAATAINTALAIVKRDASGNFSAGTITASLTGNVSGNVSGTSANVTGIVAIANGGTNSSATLNNNRVMQSLGGSIVEAAAILPNQALISDANGIPTASTTTATELSYVHGVTSSIQTQINSISGAAITALTGDVSATGPGSVAATVNSVGGSTAANIHSAELAANAATTANTPNTIVKRDGSGNISGANFSGSSSGTNTGDVTTTSTNSITLGFSSGQTGLSANLNLSAAAADSGNVKATYSIKSDGLFIELPFGTPVQIGTSNSPGAASSFSLSDHVHAITASVVTGLALTGYTVGSNVAIAATDTILAAFGKVQGQINATVGAAITALTGDVTATGPGSVAATIAVGAVTDTKASLATKPAVTVVATSNQTLSGVPTIDGQLTAAGTSIVLLTAQTTTSQNGPWIVQSGAWTRPTWYPSGGTSQAFQFITCFVRLGTTYQGSVWRQTAPAPITIDTTATTWSVTPTSGNYKSSFVVGPQTGSSEVDLVFSNANQATLGWNPTSTFKLLLPPSVPTAGQFLSALDNAGTLAWSNPNVNIDGGSPTSVYTTAQTITGGTP